MAENPDLISGIYNYCDRWCERCQFTSRCLNYLSGQEHYDTPESRDMNNKEFWNKLQESFQLTMEMLKGIYQIHVKLMRALQQDDTDDLEILKDMPKDSDGSAKVALVGIDRSISAWVAMRNHFPEMTDDVLNLLLPLDWLRKNIEEEFPEARNFVRPGFDE